MTGTHKLNGNGPTLILAHPNVEYMARIGRAFRRLDWTVHYGHDADSVRRLAFLHAAELVVMATELPGESGWLACEKLTRERHDVKVVLVTDEVTAQQERFAAFVGAARLLSVHSAPAALLELVGRTV